MFGYPLRQKGGGNKTADSCMQFYLIAENRTLILVMILQLPICGHT